MNSVCRILFLLLIIEGALTRNTTDYNDLVVETLKIFQNCFFSKRADTLLLAGRYDEFLKLHPRSVALISTSKRSAFDTFTLTRYSFFVHAEYSFAKLVQKLRYFLVVSISQPELRLLFQRIKDSTWANAYGFYILIDRYTETRGCVNAEFYLRAAWDFDLTSAVVFCIHPADGLLLYSYNPYSDKSPRVWEEEAKLIGRRGHPWRLLKRKYRPGLEICKDLVFDKTIALDGYEIRMNAIPMEPLLKINLSKNDDEKFGGDNGEIIKIMTSKLNASLYVMIYNGTSYDLGEVGPNGTMIGMLADVSSGVVDMGMNTRPLYVMWKLRYTYPHVQSGLCVITQPSGYVSEFKKFMGFMPPKITLILYAVTILLFLALAKHEGFMLAFLDLLRFVTSVSMLNLPSGNPSRILIATTLLLFIIVNAIFQAHWAALLTVPVSYPNINTLQDIRRSTITIYGPKLLTKFMEDLNLVDRYQSVNYNECKEHVKKSDDAACMGDCLHLYERIRHEKLHHSKKILQLAHVYVARENWPLFARVNTVVQRLVEAGLVSMWRRQNVRHIFRERRVRRMKNNSGFKVLKLKQLAFSFYILTTGYLCACIAFLMEFAVARYHRDKRISKGK